MCIFYNVNNPRGNFHFRSPASAILKYECTLLHFLPEYFYFICTVPLILLLPSPQSEAVVLVPTARLQPAYYMDGIYPKTNKDSSAPAPCYFARVPDLFRNKNVDLDPMQKRENCL